ncbi:hypothetical protein [Litorihabitans aurantiacus]|uniref:hypothetical protein n=1 Tax=Litorihabitans aurantiacus TaxID=1930061 RepID=UPI003D678722
MLGSLLTFVYASTVRLPTGSPDVASESLADALAAADGNADVIAAATTAFDTAYLVTMIVLGAMLAIGAVVTNRLLRAYGRRSQAMEFAENH